MTATITYDFAIIGAGAAGLNLALAMAEDPWFSEKQILILEKSAKDQNDKTWSFWEKGEGKFDSILTQNWDQAKFQTQQVDLSLNLAPYRYKTIRAIDFYQFARSILDNAPNVTWQFSDVSGVKQGSPATVKDSVNSYQCLHVFDSRMGPEFSHGETKSTTILQHFKGWVIESEEDIFDVGAFTMMDYRVKWKDSTSFTYVLPFSSRKALVEFTLFTPELINDKDYNWGLETYIADVLGIKSYKVLEEEKGVIPMTSFPFHKHNTSQVTRIGTAGGWVKPGSGYSFKNAQRYSKQIVANIKSGRSAHHGLFRRRPQFLDRLFLDVLYEQNELGEGIFEQMYSRSSIQDIFKFLDDETTIWQDIRIISKFRSKPFLAAFGRYIKSYFSS